MKTMTGLAIVFIICSMVINAPLTLGQQMDQSRTNELQRLSNRYGQTYRAERAEAEKLALKNGFPIVKEGINGHKIELQRIYNNIPIYYMTTNLNAAKTVSANRVWPGGDSGLNLTGAGIVIGEWDGGGVLTSHQEFGGRANQKDSPGQTNYHATHVAGTLIAQGINANAKGMASGANLIAFDWNNDVSEMAQEASGGLLLSNHSYGSITGWYDDYFNDGRWAWFGSPSISQSEDYRFGFYDEDSYLFDNIAFNAPYYLIVKSAGNDRNDYGPNPGSYHWVYNGSWVLSNRTREIDGGSDGYDCVPGGGGTSKNTLTVGAVHDIVGGYSVPGDIQMSSFSSWGPTDDGRIKPDIIANGINLYSTWNTSNTAYESIGGTSMASPNACGSLALLQEHFYNLNGIAMRAATLKGLIIHTADEAGNAEGPDYEHGWGLLNIAKAATVINDNENSEGIIQELTLDNNIPFQHQFYTDGSPVRATICWTDPAHPELSPELNPRSPVLINDLDLSIIEDMTNTLHEPYILDLYNPSSAAATGNNFVDNVEQIYISNPNPGNYTLTISNKGSLQNGSQDFSLIITGTSIQEGCFPPSISIKDTSGSFGSIVTFEVILEENPDQIDAFGFHLEYNSSVLQYVETRKAELTGDFEYLEGAQGAPNSIIVGGFDTDAIPIMSTGTIAEIDFEVICNSCNDGDVFPLQLSHLVDDVQNLNACNGNFIFSECALGDVNLDNTITPQDALCAFHIYLNGGTVPPDLGECNNPCALFASDVTCNQGEITPQDALCILNAYLNHETPPMQCCPDEYISEVDNSSSRIQLRKSIPKGVSNHMFSVEIYGRDLEKLSAFGFDIGYPYQMMSFQSIKRGDLTSTWQFIDAHENIPGVLTIGGFESDPDDTGKNGVIIELLFKTINSDVNTGDIWLFNLRDDVQTSLISNAKVSVSNSSIIGGTTIPTEYRLGQNYPNPFNPETEIRYDIPEQTNITIRIFNSMGRTIRTIVNKNQQAGSYIIRWDGKDEMGIPVSSGIYFYQMTTNQYNQIMKMILIK